MAKYMLATHTVEGASREPVTEAEAQAGWQKLGEVEEEMKATGAWFFSGRLHDPDTATVLRRAGDEVVTTDGPFVESKEHIAGFYIIEAPDLDAALGWGSKVTVCIGAPIEVRPFLDTGS
ncbi:MAG TPA: YciI family protein [Acidimicrobiales bacterium]|nr:YciI family protein [Acidimicrobiales bacterium]